jgi:hypothetical protein
MPVSALCNAAAPRASTALHQGLSELIATHGIRAVLATAAGICEARAEQMDAVTPGNAVAERWARIAVFVDIAAGRAGKL